MTSAIPLATVNYPAHLPVPNMEPYDWEVGLGTLGVKMNAGNLVIRRKWKHLPHLFNFTFSMTTDQMTQFVVFADTVGADWFNLPSISMYTGTEDTVIESQPIRFITGLGISAHGFDYWDISVIGELSPDVYLVFFDKLGNNWIIGGTPLAPSNAQWLIGGVPSAPSASWVYAGTPANPSAEI